LPREAPDFLNTIPLIADIRQRIEHVCFVPEADIRDSVGCATRRAHFLVDLILEGLTLLRDEAPVALKVNPSRNTFWRLPSRLNHTLCAPN
jgi:hypothetical protein